MALANLAPDATWLAAGRGELPHAAGTYSKELVRLFNAMLGELRAVQLRPRVQRRQDSEQNKCSGLSVLRRCLNESSLWPPCIEGNVELHFVSHLELR